MVFEEQSLAALAMAPGANLSQPLSATQNMTFSTALIPAVPLPAGLGLLLAPVGGLCLLRGLTAARSRVTPAPCLWPRIFGPVSRPIAARLPLDRPRRSG